MGNDSDLEEMWKYDYQVLYAVIGILSFLSVLGIAGNALVLSVFYQKKDMQVSTYFIIVLAFVDFTTCLIVIPYTIVLEARLFIMDSDFLCKLYHFLITSNIPFSALIMVAIAIDRYLCICHPFLHALNLTRAKVMTIFMAFMATSLGVIVSLMFGVYGIVYPKEFQFNLTVKHDISLENITNADHIAPNGNELPTNHGDQNVSDPHAADFNPFLMSVTANPLHLNESRIMFFGHCQPNEIVISEEFRFYFQKCYTALYLLCLLVVIVLYSLIYNSVLARRTRRARQKSKALPLVQLQNHEGTEGGAAPSTIEETLLTQVNGEDKSEVNGGKESTDKCLKSSKSKDHLKRTSSKSKDNFNRMANLKTAAMLFIVTVVFIITFVPAFLMALELIPYNKVIFYMYFANNVANPVIYSFMNKNFRDDLKRIFCKPQYRY